MHSEPWSAEVDIVLPVYGGGAVTRQCVESVLGAANQVPFRLLIVDDASPEPDLVSWLDSLTGRDERVRVIRHDHNLGFVHAANRGMAQHPDRDVLLLNSDTRVHGDWLDRLRACAYERAETGTVTPLSNNATLASYPVFMADNPLPAGYDVAALDALCARVNAGRSVEVPTGVGFCLYIRRDCLASVGYFDARRFGRGYGEETDFCRRASAVGFGHRLSGSVFVWHQGGVSFGASADHWRRLGGEAMREAHPDYERTIAAHVEADPQRLLRRRLDLARLTASPRPRVLNVSHAQGGGVDRHLRDMAELLSGDLELLAVTPLDGETVQLRWLRPGEESFFLVFRLPFEFDELVECLQRLEVTRVHLHHTMGLPRSLLDLPRALSAPLDFTVHDHYPLCPQANLADEHGEYCGEPDEAGCDRCLAVRPAPGGLDIRTWRDDHARLFAQAERIFVPTLGTLERYRRHFPDANLIHAPHPEPGLDLDPPMRPATREPDDAVRVLVLGVINPAKGVRLLERCAWDARRRGLKLVFRVVGWFETPIAGIEQLPLSATGPYSADELQRIVAAEQGDVLLFPSRAPETWSFTLSEGLATGLPLVATDRGAFRERLAACERAWLMPPDAMPSVWNDQLLAAAKCGADVS